MSVASTCWAGHLHQQPVLPTLEDHLPPLMVAVDAAGGVVGIRVYHQRDCIGAITASSYCFGALVI